MSEHDDEFRALPTSVGASIHDVANALTLVLGWLERAADHPGDDPQALERAMAHARWARDELRRLLGAEPVESEETAALDTIDTTVAAVVERTLDDLGVEARRAGIELRATIADACAESRTLGPQQVWQVLTNLLLNAIAASPRGARVLLAVEPRASGHLRFIVEDEGHGVPEELRATLFTRVRTGRAGGAGYGLRSAHALCEAAGGELSLLGTSSSGTRFEVVWPAVANEAPMPRPSRRDRPRPVLAGLDVYVLEDDAAVRELLALSLGARGARVRLAATLDDLEAALAVSSCDILLTDLSPLDGAEASPPRTTLDALAERARARNPKAVVLAISGSASVAASTGVRWLRKPFSTDELVAAILDARPPST